MSPLTYFDQAIEIVEAQRAALAAVRIIRGGLASRTLLGDLLATLPLIQRAPFLAEIQKTLEHTPKGARMTGVRFFLTWVETPSGPSAALASYDPDTDLVTITTIDARSISAQLGGGTPECIGHLLHTELLKDARA